METTFNESSRTPWTPPDVEITRYQDSGSYTYYFKSASRIVETRSVRGYKGGTFVPGVLKLRPFTAKRSRLNLGTGVCIRRTKGSSVYTVATGYLSAQTNGMPTTDTYFPSVPSQIRDVALTKAMAKFQASGESLGEFLAELPESIRMINNGIHGVIAALRRARRSGFSWSRAARALRAMKNGRRLKQLPADLSSAWLTWRYGIRPLFWDVLMLCKIAGEKAKLPSNSGLLRKRATESFESERSSDSHFAKYGVIDYYAKLRWTTEARCTASVYYRLLHGVNPRSELLRYYGLHPEQIPALLWELTPLSFVVDWFTNVGDFVRALSPRPDVEVLGWSSSLKITRRATSSDSSLNSSRNATDRTYSYEVSVPADTYVSEELSRTVGNSNPGVSIRINPQIMLSIQQNIDLVTLAIQRWLATRRRP